MTPPDGVGRAKAVALAIAVAAGLLAAYPLARSLASADGGAPVVAVRIDAVAEISAGETVDVIVWSSDPEGSQVPLQVITAAATIERQVTVVAGRGVVTLGEPLTSAAGVLTLAAPGPVGMLSRSVVIGPGESSGQLVPLVGPRTIVADGQDHTMVVAIPVDERGNTVAEGTEVVVAARHPGGELVQARLSTAHGLAHTTLQARTEAGTATVSTTSGVATGPAIEFEEVAGAPSEIELSADQRDLRADGRSLHRVTTESLLDRYGNLVSDGVVLRFSVEDPSGVRQLSSVVLGGRAEVVLEAPDQPGAVQVTATVAGVTSTALTLEFQPAVSALPAIVQRVDGRSIVHIGPVTDALGATLPDGTEVTVGDRVAVLENGRASVLVARSDVLTVEVLGVRVDVGEAP